MDAPRDEKPRNLEPNSQMHVFDTHQSLGHFQIQQSVAIEDLRCSLTIAQHMPTGARVVHIGNQDPENLFCLSFSTPPPDATGISHILEHCALCGSKRFPVKDPFFSMTRRSLCTFMNAFTGPDFTCYPAASQVPGDFYNLLDVYQDAVFSPLLTPASFWQEGVRLERTGPAKERLLYHGIVYNEMKGAFASGETRLWAQLNHLLFPKTPYRFESGGHPDQIPQLTLARMRAYHERHYHPSRCLFYFYGNLPLVEHLQFLENTSLKGQALPPREERAERQTRFERPRQLQGTYPSAAGGEASGALFGMGWWLCEMHQSEELWVAHLLEELLLGSDAAPLKRALIEGGHCAQVQGILQADVPQIPFVLFLKGCREKDADVLGRVVLEALAKIANVGFTSDEIAAAIHRLELQHLEIDAGQGPYGLSLFWRVAPSLQHGVDPLLALRIEQQIRQLKIYQERPNGLGMHLRRFLIDNTHRADVLLQPDAEMDARERDQEEHRLANLAKTLSKVDAEQIDRDTAALKHAQDASEDLSCLPAIPIDQIAQEPQYFPLQSQEFNAGTLHVHDVFTNGFLYIDCFIPLPDLGDMQPFEHLAHSILPQVTLLRLLTSFWPRVGAEGKTFAKHSEEIAAHTGGIASEITCLANANSAHNDYFLRMRVKGLCTKRVHLCGLLAQTMRSASFCDAPRIQDLLTQHWVQLQHSLPSEGLSYALQMASSAHSCHARGHGALRGLEYYQSIRDLWHALQKDPTAIEERLLKPLQTLYRALLAPKHLVITCDRGDLTSLREGDYFGLKELFTQGHAPALELASNAGASLHSPQSGTSHVERASHRALAIPSQVASNVLSLPAPCFADAKFPQLQLIAQLIQHQTLHPEIRERGGAYGSGAHLRNEWGAFVLFSSRDPHIASTAAIFEEALRRLAHGGCSEDELDAAKRVVLQRLDTPVTPGERGELEWAQQMRGQSRELRAQQRKRLLLAKPEELQLCCQTYLLPKLLEAGFATAAHSSLLQLQVPQIPLEML